MIKLPQLGTSILNFYNIKPAKLNNNILLQNFIANHYPFPIISSTRSLYSTIIDSKLQIQTVIYDPSDKENQNTPLQNMRKLAYKQKLFIQFE